MDDFGPDVWNPDGIKTLGTPVRAASMTNFVPMRRPSLSSLVEDSTTTTWQAVAP